MSKGLYLGIDMGGTHIKMAIVNSDGSIIEETLLDTDIKEKPLNILKSIVKKAKELENYSKVLSIGVGIAGDIDVKTGKLRFSPNLPAWKNVPLKSILEKLTGKEVFVDNDANTAAIGAFCMDAKNKANDLICITLGTGVGGGLIFDKKLYRGASCTAGEIGHISIDYNGPKCKCGNYGCIETYMGAKYISDFARIYLKKHPSKIINELTENKPSKITPQILHTAALKGDKVANAIWKDRGEKLGVFLSVIINFANPDTIVLCGGVSRSGKYLLEPAVKEMKKRAFKSASKACKIILSKYTQKLGVVGAAMLPKHKLS